MTIKTLHILFLIGLLSLCNVYGQQNDSIKENITTLNRIDSLVTSIDSNKNCRELISEGEIMKDNKIIGGFSTYSRQEEKTNKTLRIRHQSSTDFYYKTTFYYDADKIIFATVVIEDWNSNKFKVIYNVKYYFKNDTLLLAIDEDEKYSTASDILIKGQKYLNKE